MTSSFAGEDFTDSGNFDRVNDLVWPRRILEIDDLVVNSEIHSSLPHAGPFPTCCDTF